MSLEQDYYDFLTRIDHPVFFRDFSTTTDKDSPLNSIQNRLMAKQLVRMRESLDKFIADCFPHTVTEDGIGLWESRYFGFIKSGNIAIETRREQLMVRINTRVGLTVEDVKNIAYSFTGKIPRVIRNNYFSNGWVLDQGVLGVDTILNADDTDENRRTYTVIFDEVLTSDLLNRIDVALTNIEKAGSLHNVFAPSPYWILDESVLGVDTIL